MRSVLVVLVSLPVIVLLAFILLAADTTVLSLSSGPMMRWGVLQEAASAAPPTARRGEGVVLVEKEEVEVEEEEEAEALLLPCNYTLLSSRPESVYWKGRRGAEKEGGGRPEGLEPYSRVCSMSRFTDGEAVARCLAGRRLVFVGDSLSRYQYLSLVHVLEFGWWDVGGKRGDGRAITYRQGWGNGSWNSFYRDSSEAFNGHEACDCHRTTSRGEFVENRYYHSPGHESVSVAFVGWFGHTPQGHGLSREAGMVDNITQASLGCRAGECSSPVTWRMDDIPSFLLASPQLLGLERGDVLLLNRGLWQPLTDGEEIAAIAKAAAALQQATGVQAWFKTTTSRPLEMAWVDDSRVRRAFLSEGLGVFDASIFTVPLRGQAWVYRDQGSHYEPEVYHGLNTLLLNHLCSPHGGG